MTGTLHVGRPRRLPPAHQRRSQPMPPVGKLPTGHVTVALGAQMIAPNRRAISVEPPGGEGRWRTASGRDAGSDGQDRRGRGAGPVGPARPAAGVAAEAVGGQRHEPCIRSSGASPTRRGLRSGQS
jgi:hypothetical protein